MWSRALSDVEVFTVSNDLDFADFSADPLSDMSELSAWYTFREGSGGVLHNDAPGHTSQADGVIQAGAEWRWHGLSYTFEDELAGSCATGYTGTPVALICGSDGVWALADASDSPSGCALVDCGAAPVGYEYTADSNTTYGSVVNFSCVEGYSGLETPVASTCLASGQWDLNLETYACTPNYCTGSANHNYTGYEYIDGAWAALGFNGATDSYVSLEANDIFPVGASSYSIELWLMIPTYPDCEYECGEAGVDMGIIGDILKIQMCVYVCVYIYMLLHESIC